MATRITKNVTRGEAITLNLNGERVRAHTGETVAAILLVQGITNFSQTQSGQARAPYCNMGVCFECRVYITRKGIGSWERACMIFAEEGMSITTGSKMIVDRAQSKVQSKVQTNAN